MLEERLLENPTMSYDTELKNLELMKLRFGDKHLLNCEVMLRDIKDSERINRAVQKQYKDNMMKNQIDSHDRDSLEVNKLYVKVVSSGYWDKFMQNDDDANDDENESDQQDAKDGHKKKAKLSSGFAPSQNLKRSLDEFESQFNFYKRQRTLVFRQNMGTVEMTLTFQNGSFKFHATPIQATVLSLFGSDDPAATVTLALTEIQSKLTNPNASQTQTASQD